MSSPPDRTTEITHAPERMRPDADRAVSGLDRLLDALSFDSNDPASVGQAFVALVEGGFDRLPLPAHGDTAGRWRSLASVAARDLALVKLFEGHTDALAILDELNGPVAPPGSRWGTWAAEPRDARVTVRPAGGDGLRLDGTKAWCSGMNVVTNALVTAWREGEPVLVAVDMHQPQAISRHAGRWCAVGMHGTMSGDVRFDGAHAIQVGDAHAYVRRPGFWQGGAGIAACWFGAAAGLAQNVRNAVATRSDDPHLLVHLGNIDVALSGAAAVLRETATYIDTHPAVSVEREALRARLVTEATANRVMECAGRALGAGPLCTDARFARTMADLPVFLRQSHAERDLAALGRTLIDTRNVGEHEWTL